jgi:hypothetical protein
MSKINLNRIHDSLVRALFYGWSIVHLYRTLFPR